MMKTIPFETFNILDISIAARSRGPIIKRRIEIIFSRMVEHKYKFSAEPANAIFGVNISEVARWCGMKNRNPFYTNDNYKVMLKNAITNIGIYGENPSIITESLLKEDLDERQKDIGSLKRQIQSLQQEKRVLSDKVDALNDALLEALDDNKDAERKIKTIHESIENQRENLMKSGGRGYVWLK